MRAFFYCVGDVDQLQTIRGARKVHCLERFQQMAAEDTTTPYSSQKNVYFSILMVEHEIGNPSVESDEQL